MEEKNITTMEELLKKYGDDVKELTDLARLAEQSERFEEMSQFMAALVKRKKKIALEDKKDVWSLEIAERNMLSVAYKNVVGARRSSWRSFTSESDVEETDDHKANRKAYVAIVEKELSDKCQEILDLIEKDLLPSDATVKAMSSEETSENYKKDIREGVIFYLKMCGDYYRYLAEFQESNESIKTKASANYDAALAVAKETLDATHPTHLGLILNASVCKYEILKKPDEARKLAKEGFDNAIQKLDSLSDATYKDSTLIMQLLRDNLTIWTAQEDNNQEDRED